MTVGENARRAIASAARQVLAATGEQPEAEREQAGDSVEVADTKDAAAFARELEGGTLAVEEARVTRLLHGRLSAAAVAEMEAKISANWHLAENYDDVPEEVVRQQRLLAFGVYLGEQAVIAGTGLPAVQAPDDIHQMARGPFAAAGGLYEADLVVDALASANGAIEDVASALDFGCSSGRVLRVLAAAYPHVQWRGCDPNGPAIEWAGANLPGITFSVNGDEPPLELASGSLDLAYAISIWSHFEPLLGLRWFAEMHRLIKPGGHLVWTTHGLASVEYYARFELRTPEQSQEIADALYRQGWWYAAEFGEEGDWGVVNPAWGTAFLSPEWVLTQLCPQWRVLEFAAGRNQGNQDVYVLQRA